MSEIASAIRVGANAFISYEYKVLYTVVAVVAVIMAIVTTWHAAWPCSSARSCPAALV